MDIEKFDRSLSRLTEYGLVDNKTYFSLYNWGEPTLHPELYRIIQLVQDKYGFSYGLSTNAGKSVEYRSDWFRKLRYLTISMCGFSQESYDKVHQFDFEKVKSNIVSIVNAAKTNGYNTRKICIVHHIYQFNIHEVPMLNKWARTLNVSYNPYFAFINDPAVLRRYASGTLSMEEMKSVAENLFCHYINKRIQSHPRNDCRLFDVLTIDEECNVVTCCAIERDHTDSVITNIFDPNFYEKLANWQPHGICVSCMANGLSPLNEIGDSFPFPESLYKPKPYFIKRVLETGKKIERFVRHKIRHKK